MAGGLLQSACAVFRAAFFDAFRLRTCTGVRTERTNVYGGGVHSAWRRLKRVLPAYLVWSAAYLLLEAASGAPHAHPVRDILTGKAYMHLYYIPVLVQFIVLSGPLQRAARRFPRRTLVIAAAVSLAAQAVLCA